MASRLGLLSDSPAYRHLWLSRLISSFGDRVNSVAVLGLAISLTGSGSAVAMVMLSRLVPSLALGLPAGVAADRFSRKRLMIASDLVRVCIACGFLLLHSPEQAWMVYVLSTLLSTASLFFEPAYMAALPTVVPERSLTAANALNQVSFGLTMVFGALFGGMLSGWLGRGFAFTFNAATFLASAVLIWSCSIPAFSRSRSGGNQSHDAGGLREGLRYVRSNTAARSLILLYGIGWAPAYGVVVVLFSVFPTNVFGRGDMGIGTILAAIGAGVVAGSLAAPRMVRADLCRMRKAAGIAPLAYGVLALGFGLSPDFTVSVVVSFLMGSVDGFSTASDTTLLMKVVGNEFRGRVIMVLSTLNFAVMAGTTLLAGVALDHVDPRVLMAATGPVFALTGLLWLGLARLRLHDAVQSPEAA